MKNKINNIGENEAMKEIEANFLREENGELCFSNMLNHVLFELDKDNDSFDETQQYSIDFDTYVQKFMEICTKVKNKPSLLFLNYVPKDIVKVLNGKKRNYEFLTTLGSDEEYKSFNEKPCITCVQEWLCVALRRLIETRSKINPQNDVFVFFNEPEYSHNLKNPSLDTIVSVSRSRRIYFVFNFLNKAKYIELYGEESYQIIKDNCRIKFN